MLTAYVVILGPQGWGGGRFAVITMSHFLFHDTDSVGQLLVLCSKATTCTKRGSVDLRALLIRSVL